MTACEVWSQKLLECIAATASAASSVDKSSGKDGGMSSQSMIHQCLGKVKDMQSQLTKKPLWLFARKEFKLGWRQVIWGEMFNVVHQAAGMEIRENIYDVAEEIYVNSYKGWSKYNRLKRTA